MKKILIIGSGGAGKSTFARRLGEATGLPIVHLDYLFWNPGWVETPKDQWGEKVKEALLEESWIMDGNYGGTLETRVAAADTIIFLETPRLVCIYRILKRLITYRPGTRPDMAQGCHEKFDWKFIKWVWNYPTRSKPKVEKLLKKFEGAKKVVRLGSKREIEDFFAPYSKTPVVK